MVLQKDNQKPPHLRLVENSYIGFRSSHYVETSWMIHTKSKT